MQSFQGQRYIKIEKKNSVTWENGQNDKVKKKKNLLMNSANRNGSNERCVR